MRRRPYSVVLFDEIEKAHPDVMNILLQILDEGKINDAQGRTVDFSNTVICMTSNAGSSDQSTSSLGFNKSEVDEVITFKPLSEETLQGIAALMLDEYKPGMDAKGIAYRYTPAALKALVKKSEGGKFGARDLRRVIRKAVEDPAAEKLIDGTLASGSGPDGLHDRVHERLPLGEPFFFCRKGSGEAHSRFSTASSMMRRKVVP